MPVFSAAALISVQKGSNSRMQTPAAVLFITYPSYVRTFFVLTEIEG